MSAPHHERGRAGEADPREIALWAKRYAKSRTIPFLVQWVFIVLLGVVIAGGGYVTLQAYQTENMVWFLLCAGGILGTVIALAWFSVPHWGGDQIYRISQWIYGEEGFAADWTGDPDEDMHGPWWVYAAGVGLAVYHIAGALLIAGQYLPLKYMQPFSALYMAPFFVVMIASQRLGFWAYLWPGLYGLHAILIAAGAPIRFTDVKLEILNMIVPVFGYGFVAIVFGHLYSRYALRKLKRLARMGLDDAPDDVDADEADAGEDGDA